MFILKNPRKLIASTCKKIYKIPKNIVAVTGTNETISYQFLFPNFKTK